jgi:hypothetical protein
MSGFLSLEVELVAIIQALAVLKDAVAAKGQFSSACREPEQGNSRGGCGNASDEVEVVQKRLLELIASRGAGSLCPGERNVVQRPGLSELSP